MRSGGVFSVEITESTFGFVAFVVSGEGAEALFANESGGHRWQQESKDKIHTSTITVAVLAESEDSDFKVEDKDLEWSTSTSQGPGGQGANTTYSCVILKHRPSGVSVRCQNERSQFQNKKTALRILRARLIEHHENELHEKEAKDRKDQIGSGQRGDKRRTIRVKDGQVKDHVTGQSWEYKRYVKGDW